MTWTLEELSRRSDDQVAEIVDRVSNRVAKWRSVFASWQLGTRLSTDPESQAVRDRDAVAARRRDDEGMAAVTPDVDVQTLRDTARGREIAAGLAGAIERAAEDLAALGLDSDEGGEFITDVFIGSDWASCFEDEDA